VCFYPASPAHQALLIVCLFGVALGGVNLTAVYKPSFYGFVLPALLPLILRVASGGDDVHRSIAAVMSVVLLFLLAFGHQVNALLTRSLMIRHENTDLIAELKAQTDAAQTARTAAENANRAKSQFLAAASHDLRQPLHCSGCSRRRWRQAARRRPAAAGRQHQRLGRGAGGLFAQLLDLRASKPGRCRPRSRRCRSPRCSNAWPPSTGRRPRRAGCGCASARRRSGSPPTRCCWSACCAIW
jgi:hypothetical protein